MPPVILPSPTAEILRDRRLSLPSEHAASATSPPLRGQGPGPTTAETTAAAIAAATAAVAASTQRAIRSAEQARAEQARAEQTRAEKARASDAAPSSSAVLAPAAAAGPARDEQAVSVPADGPVQFVISPMVLDIIVARVVSNVRAGVVHPNLKVSLPRYARSDAISVVPPVAATAASAAPAASTLPTAAGSAGPASSDAPAAPTLAPSAANAQRGVSPEPGSAKAQASLKQAPRPLPLHPADVGVTTTRTRRSFAQVAASGRTNEKLF